VGVSRWRSKAKKRRARPTAATYSRLKTLSIEPHACLDHGMTTSFYYEDPDGNSVELQSDNVGSWQESSEWMRTSPQFASDPTGMPINPEQMVTARQAGASFTEGPTLASFSLLALSTCMCRLGIHALRGCL
jgi:catechol-2,3-dioxygenase